MQVVLTVIRGKGVGRSFEIAPLQSVVVGRGADADFSFAAHDTHMSRRHFKIDFDGTDVKLVDLGSANRTIVRGSAVRECALADGDVVAAGTTLLRVDFKHSHSDAAIPTYYHMPTVDAQASTPSQGASLLKTVSGGSTRTCIGCGVGYLSQEPVQPSYPLCSYCREEANDHFQPVPGYLFLRMLGRGGAGVVWLGLRESDGKRFAIKALVVGHGTGQTTHVRFRREASVLQDLIHPHIVGFHEMKTIKDEHYLVMEYIPGQDAARLLAAQGPFEIPRAVDLACQLLEALDYAHAKRFVHRDIKPSNLLIVRENGREVVKLADFGLARIVEQLTDHAVTTSNDRAGTPSFIAPEQIRDFRNAKPATDQYAVGATLYNLLTNQYVFRVDGSAFDFCIRVLEEEPVPIRKHRPEISEELAAIIHKALQKDPSRRFRNVVEMRRALSKLEPGLSSVGSTPWKSP